MLDIDVQICDRGARFVISGSKSVIWGARFEISRNGGARFVIGVLDFRPGEPDLG